MRQAAMLSLARMSSPPPRPQPVSLADLELVVTTARLRLRPLAATDVEDLWPTVSDPTFPAQMSWAAHADRAETLAWIRGHQAGIADGRDLTWAIEHAGRAVGTIGLGGITWEMRALRLDRAELGYWLARPQWGQGLMSEAAYAAVRFGFETLGLHKITVGCFPDNAGSKRVIEKLGFRFVGQPRDDVWRDGAWHDHLRYELTAAEWSDVSTTLRVPISRPRPT